MEPQASFLQMRTPGRRAGIDPQGRDPGVSLCGRLELGLADRSLHFIDVVFMIM